MAGVAEPRLIIALDVPTQGEALALLDRLDPALCRVKVGKELFTRCGPDLVARIHERGYGVFLDLKYHDIPNTVAGACRAAAELGVWMVNVHALGGQRMLQAAREAIDSAPHGSPPGGGSPHGGLPAGSTRPLLTAVTVLTSMEASDLAGIGIERDPAEFAALLADVAAAAGLDGIVCSAREASALRARHGEELLLVTPGIRPQSSAADDQRRILTPGQALAAGADHLVIGRPVTRAPDPAAVLRTIAREVAAATTH